MKRKSFFKTLLLILLLPVTVIGVKSILDLRKSASGTPANIIVDLSTTSGRLSPALWQNIAQGGEEATDMVGPVINQTRSLSPQLIRIDHLFDYYNIYQASGQYNFSALDSYINSILATGAVPMLSVSYTPALMSKSGQVAGQPIDWGQWQSLVTALAHRYSVEKNINGIYYEVWNEPDLFGSWHYGKEPNYLTLYSQTVSAIQQGAPGKNYKVGGPATTNFYSNWIEALFKHCQVNNLPLDFISWHQYDKDLEKYDQNIEKVNTILTNYPQFFNVERIITEFGPNPEPDVWYDTKLSGVHLLSAITRLSGKIHRLFTFELIDGPQSRSTDSSGWGLISHSNNGQKEKPRFYALKFLNQLNGLRLNSHGDGSWVTSLATKTTTGYQILLVNYDSRNTHHETFPLTFQAIQNRPYVLKQTNYLGGTNQKTITPSTTTYTETIYMEPNTAILLELTPQ